jgi:hypothetical protein
MSQSKRGAAAEPSAGMLINRITAGIAEIGLGPVG